MIERIQNSGLLGEKVKGEDHTIGNQSSTGSAAEIEAVSADLSNNTWKVGTENGAEGTGNRQKDCKTNGEMPEEIRSKLQLWHSRKFDLYEKVKELPKIPIRLGEDSKTNPSLQEFLREKPDEPKTTLYSSVCTHRLSWIVMHALGIVSDDAIGDDPSHVIGYGSMVNYTNFGQLSVPGTRIHVNAESVIQLSEFIDGFVKDETAILMECAAHDNRRPWIDGADVALVKALRKDFSNH